MTKLIETYLTGPQILRDAVAGMTEDQLAATPVPSKWSTRQVICHIADCEIVYADRMKRVVVEDKPTLLNLDPDTFAAGLVYDQRDVEEELELIEATRRHMGRILRNLEPVCFQLTGNHSTDGLLTLENLLQRITGYIIERVSSQSYEDYIVEHILQPLGVSTPKPVEPTPEMVEVIGL